MIYPIIQIPDNAPELPEQQGTKAKYWVRLKPDDEQKMLFKIGRKNTGENWSEKVACELAELLHLPHAHYDFAICKEDKGIISKNFVPAGCRLITGNELLSDVHASYCSNSKYKAQDHTLGRIFTYLNNPVIQFPIDWKVPTPAIENAVDVFLGYLLLDAWIANQDRHHENWGVVNNYDDQIYLAPTFDHAASLGQNEQNDKRILLLKNEKSRTSPKKNEKFDRNQTIECYVKKAKSAIYLNKLEKKPLSTIEAFQLMGQRRPDVTNFWLTQLNNVTTEQCYAIFNQIPKTEISNIDIEFASKMLELNKKRLLEAGQ